MHAHGGKKPESEQAIPGQSSTFLLLSKDDTIMSIRRTLCRCYGDSMENDIHLLDRTETNIIFIWSGKVILGEAKPSPNITLPDEINMILGEVLSNKCFIIPATLCAPGPSHALLIQTKKPFTRYKCAFHLYKFACCVIYFRT